MKNVSDKIFREIQNIQFMFNNSPPPLKIRPFMKKCGKILYSGTGHR